MVCVGGSKARHKRASSASGSPDVARRWLSGARAGQRWIRGRSMMHDISEEATLIAAAIVAVGTLFIARSLWFPALAVQALFPAPECQLSVSLNMKGALEGPWLNATWQQDSVGIGNPAYGSLTGPGLVGQGKVVALEVDGDDGAVQPQFLTEGIEQFEETGNVLTLTFARLAERYLATWTRLEGIPKGLGKRGLIKAEALRAMATNPKLWPCVAHVRVVGGRVYFRYGSFLQSASMLQRINLSVRSMQEAVDKFNLKDLKAELYLNACEDPQSYDNSLSAGRSGFAVFSTQLTPGSTDIPYPDPLDLLHVAHTPASTQSSWHRRESKAVWRGQGFEFALRATNWASSFRLRLHRMAEVRPDLLDAKITEWGPKDRKDAKDLLQGSGMALGAPMSTQQQIDEFKFRLVVDERVGTREMCSALVGPQAIIRHVSGYQQYFDPLLLPGVHYAQVRHSLADLYESVEWMKANDAAMQQMVKNANAVAPLICTQEAHVHYWAVMLAKYAARAVEEPEKVSAPAVCQGGKALVSAEWTNDKSPATCKHPNGERCTDFCVDKKDEKDWTWLDSSAIGDLSQLLEPL